MNCEEAEKRNAPKKPTGEQSERRVGRHKGKEDKDRK